MSFTTVNARSGYRIVGQVPVHMAASQFHRPQNPSTFRGQLPTLIDSIPGGAARPWVLPAGAGAGCAAAVLTGTGTLSASVNGRLSAAANLQGSSTLSAPLRLTIYTGATLQGAGTVEASMSSPAHMRALIKIGADPGADEIADAVWQRQTDAHTDPEVMGGLLALLGKLARNKTVTDPSTGTITVYDDDGVTPLLTAALHEDVAGSQPYRGQGADRRERLE